jgi:heme/copper-type cytochrome/quinol oxidase subunit 3
MAREAVIRKYVEPVGTARVPAFGGGEPPAPPRTMKPIVSNARIAVLMFIAAEAMFFAGLIGGFIVFRLAAQTWPPAFQPRLPVGVTGVNTAILLLSGVAMQLAMRAARAGAAKAIVIRRLACAAVLGAIFLLVQGFEWVRLIHYGLTLSSSVYGATFYTLIGCHGAHVLGAALWLAVVLARVRRGTAGDEAVALCGIYWTFVVALWPALYVLVYL